MDEKKFTFPSETVENRERTLEIGEPLDAEDTSTATKIFTPKTFESGKEIVETLVNKKSVIVSINELAEDSDGIKIATRLIDFICGATYAYDGVVQKINKFTFYFSIKKEN